MIGGIWTTFGQQNFCRVIFDFQWTILKDAAISNRIFQARKESNTEIFTQQFHPAPSPVWPPPSPPWAQMRSTPASSALPTCFTAPIMFMTSELGKILGPGPDKIHTYHEMDPVDQSINRAYHWWFRGVQWVNDIGGFEGRLFGTATQTQQGCWSGQCQIFNDGMEQPKPWACLDKWGFS